MSGRQGFSKLPGDDAYWTSLEARVAGAVLADRRAASMGRAPAEPWHAALTRRATGLGLVAAAAAVLLLLLPPRAVEGGEPAGAASSAPRLQALIGAEAPPPLAALLLPAAGVP